MTEKNYALLGDSPVAAYEDDHLEFKHTAGVLAGAAIDTKAPLTIGIFGRWGAGKTSLMQLIKYEIEAKHGAKSAAVWFNAWQYEKEEHLIVPIVATINRELERKEKEAEEAENIKETKNEKSFWSKEIRLNSSKIRKALRAIAHGVSIKGKVGIPLFSEVEANLSPGDMFERYQELSRDSVLARSLYFDAFDRLDSCTKIECKPGEENEALRIVVFVDDLDRCLPGKALELIEHIKLVLHRPGFSFVIGVNEEIIQEVVRKKFENEYKLDPSFAEDYLHKITQVQIDVPEREIAGLQKYIEALLEQSGEDFGEDGKQEKEKVVPLLAQIANGNPRAIVRRLNRIMVNLRVGRAEGKDLNFLALVIDDATREVRFRRFRKTLDIRPEPNKPYFGKMLHDLIEGYSGQFNDIAEKLDKDENVKQYASLRIAIELLCKHEYLYNVLKTEDGLKWLRNFDYRNTVGASQKRAGDEVKLARSDSIGSTGELPGELRKLLENMKPIPGGTFIMGSANLGNAKPHEVKLSSFEICAAQVTQELYEFVMGENPSRFKDPLNPVEQVSWHDAMEFCETLTGITGKKFILPTEAQWEYACKSGSVSEFCFGSDEVVLGKYAWYARNSNGRPHPVLQKKPNKWGLYDMHGNVWEWCLDWYGDYTDNLMSESDPKGPDSGSSRVFRGGSWFDSFEACQSAYRSSAEPGSKSAYLGFRVVSFAITLTGRYHDVLHHELECPNAF